MSSKFFSIFVFFIALTYVSAGCVNCIQGIPTCNDCDGKCVVTQQTCNFCASAMCSKYCTESNSCNNDQYCSFGLCTAMPFCYDDNDCPTGLKCGADLNQSEGESTRIVFPVRRQCVKVVETLTKCESSSDCTETEYCHSDTCMELPKCYSDNGCPLGSTCTSSLNRRRDKKKKEEDIDHVFLRFGRRSANRNSVPFLVKGQCKKEEQQSKQCPKIPYTLCESDSDCMENTECAHMQCSPSICTMDKDCNFTICTKDCKKILGGKKLGHCKIIN